MATPVRIRAGWPLPDRQQPHREHHPPIGHRAEKLPLRGQRPRCPPCRPDVLPAGNVQAQRRGTLRLPQRCDRPHQRTQGQQAGRAAAPELAAIIKISEPYHLCVAGGLRIKGRALGPHRPPTGRTRAPGSCYGLARAPERGLGRYCYGLARAPERGLGSSTQVKTRPSFMIVSTLIHLLSLNLKM